MVLGSCIKRSNFSVYRNQIIAAASFASLAAGIVGFLYFMPKMILSRMIFKQPEKHYPNASLTLDESGYASEVKSSTGAKVSMVIDDKKRNADDANKDKILVVFCNSEQTMSEARDHLRTALDDQYGKVVYFDYPNTGLSKKGKIIVDKESLVAAGEAVVEELMKTNKCSNITVYGHSLGAGVAAETAVRLQRKGHDIGGFICDRGFTSSSEAASAKMPKLPKWLASVCMWLYNMELKTEYNFNKFQGSKHAVYTNIRDLHLLGSAFKGDKETGVGLNRGHLAPPTSEVLSPLSSFKR